MHDTRIVLPTFRKSSPRRILAAATIMLAILAGPTVSDAAGNRPRMSWMLPTDAPATEVVEDTVPGSNTIVDLITTEGGGGVWAATGQGASHFTFSRGNWQTFNSEDGLGSDEIPAMHVQGEDVWVATSHSQVYEKQLVPTGDGLFRSTNDGLTWTDISPDLDQASAPFMICYDITPFRSGMVAACFAGGLVLTIDGGQTWTNIFASTSDQSDFENRNFARLSNRYFSAVVDPTVPDSLALYTGTAEGIAKFIFLDSALKVTGVDFRDLWVDGSRILAGSEGGVSRTLTRGATWRSFYEENGLPTNNVSTIHAAGGSIMVGVETTPGGAGAGLAFSSDSGASWVERPALRAIGEGRGVRSILRAAGAWWAACQAGGLIRSTDDGVTWNSVTPDSTHAADLRDHEVPLLATNHVNSLAALTDGDSTSLWAGTDGGVITYRIVGESYPESAEIVVVDEDGSMTTRVAGVFHQASPVSGDLVWALCAPGGSVTSGDPGHAVSEDGGHTWIVANSILSFQQAAFVNSQYYLIGASGLRQGTYPEIDADDMTTVTGFQTLVTNNRIGDELRDVVVETINVDGNPTLSGMWVASDSGLAFSLNAGADWGVIFSNPDPYEWDRLQRTTYGGRDTLDTEKFLSISGNFITALGFQSLAGLRVIWAGTQSTSTGHKNGISRSENGGLSWTVPITGHRVWNFEFDGQQVWAASSEGLLHSPDGGGTWDTLMHFVDPSSGAVIDSQTEVFSVTVVGDEVWVGTENGLAVLDRANPETVLRVRRTFEAVGEDVPSGEGGTYATPVPFSPDFHPDGLRFHYKPPVTGPVTITIYDFSNRIVKVVTEGAERLADVEYHEADIWDGRNGKGDFVAVGTYVFTIEYSNGDVHWGKLAVLP